MIRPIARLHLVLVVALLIPGMAAAEPGGAQVTAAAETAAGAVLFVENAGQWPADARFQVWGGPGTLWLAQDALWLTVVERGDSAPAEPRAPALEPWAPDRPAAPDIGVNLKLSFVDASPAVQLVPARPLTTTVSYFLGNDPAQWRPAVPVWGEVRYAGLYPGIDLVIQGMDSNWCWQLVGKPTSALKAVPLLRIEGADRVTLDGASLRLATAAGEVMVPLPSAQVGLRVEAIDSASQLAGFYVHSGVLRPTPFNSKDPAAPADDATDLIYSTFLGGIDWDRANAIALRSPGPITIAGETLSSNFPTVPGAFDPSLNGYYDTFISRFSTDASALTYSTFLGGHNGDYAFAIAVDTTGRATVAGQTYSTDFPTTASAFDVSYNGGYYGDAFVARLNANGTALVYSTFVGGRDGDYAKAVVVDSAGQATVAGWTESSDFPTTPNAFDPSFNGNPYTTDGFVTRLSANGCCLVYSTFLGGSDYDGVSAMAMDAAGLVTVVGGAGSNNFPTTPTAFDPSYNGGECGTPPDTRPCSDAFVVRLNAAGAAIEYGTFLGGSSDDYGYGIALDALGRAYVTGDTESSNFPITPGAFDPSYNGGYFDAFVVRLNGTGSSLLYSTFLGGTAYEHGSAVAMNHDGQAIVTGSTGSPDFPTTLGAFNNSLNAPSDAFITRLGADGRALVYSTFLGGDFTDAGSAIAIDNSGHSIVTGITSCIYTCMPTTPFAYDRTFNGGVDAFVSVLNLVGYAPNVIASIEMPVAGSVVTGTVTLSGYAIDLASSAGTGVDRVHAYLDGSFSVGTFLGEATYGLEHSGVAAQYGERFRFSGWTLDWDTNGIVPGLHWLYVYAHRTTDNAWSAPQIHLLIKEDGHGIWLPFLSH